MSRFFRRILIVLSLIFLSLPHAGPWQTEPAHATADGPHLLEQGDEGLIFELAVPNLAVTQVEADGLTYDRLSLPGYGAFGDPGHPQLLQTGVTIGMPATGDVTVRILEQQSEELPGVYNLVPVPEATILRDSQTGEPDMEAGMQYRFTPDAAAYARDAVTPDAVIAVAETAMLRQQRVARLQVTPVQYNPAQGTLRVTRYLRVQVVMSAGSTSVSSTAEGPASDPFEAVLRSQLLNYDQAKSWRIARQPEQAAPDWTLRGHPGDSSQPWLKLTVRSSGLYQVVRSDLQGSALIDVDSIDPAYLQVWKNGQQVAADFRGDGDAQFEEGEALVFYAHTPFSIYTTDTVYWLTVGSQPGERMVSADGSPTGQPAITSFPRSDRWEEDSLFVGDLPRQTDQPRWYWHLLNSFDSTSVSLPITLRRPVQSGYDAVLRVRLVGKVYPAWPDAEHHAEVYFNEELVGDVRWSGAMATVRELPLPASALVAGTNVVQVVLTGDVPVVPLDRAYLDWFELDYRQTGRQARDLVALTVPGSGARDIAVDGFRNNQVLAYDVNDPAAPLRLAGLQTTGAVNPAQAPAGPASVTNLSHRVYLPGTASSRPAGQVQVRLGIRQDGQREIILVSADRIFPIYRIADDQGSNWRDPANQADYLLITHSEFAAAAQDLAQHRIGSGLTVALVDIQDVYDEFSDGQFDPRAIRDFVSYAYHNWQAPAPSYLVLLGDGHWDYRLTTGSTQLSNFIPPYFDCVDPWLCEVAVDNEFVAVSGSDRLPDLMNGRLPANSAADARIMVNKIIAYENNPAGGDWRSTVAFVADNAFDSSGAPDLAGNFERLTEQVITLLSPEMIADRIYYDPYPDDDDGEAYRYRSQPDTTQAIIDAVNDGRLLVNYLGHASTTTWAHEHLIRARDVGRNDVTLMDNGPRLPLFIDMACLSGNFADTTHTGIQGLLLEREGGGSVGGWAATGFGVATGHDALHQGFFTAVFQNGIRGIGAATVASKQHLWNRYGTRYVDLLDTFGLLGDPALELALPDAP